MESIRELYRVGYGPSSSHTIGPRSAATHFLSLNYPVERYEAELFGSLAATGKGHLTDIALRQVLVGTGKSVNIVWSPEIEKPFHPNALTLRAIGSDDAVITEQTYYSVGGGKIVVEGDRESQRNEKYPAELNKMSRNLAYSEREGLQLWEIVMQCEGSNILTFVDEIWTVMTHSIEAGLKQEGLLPGGLELPRKAAQYFMRAKDLTGPLGTPARVLSYALAVAEENASGGMVVTAPTCGSCGVVPAVLFYLKNQYKLPKIEILRALLTAGLIGNLVKHNGSISGAEVGCQGEVGVACAMASGAAAQLLGGSIHQIEYAAEMGIEHHLGLTCDPVMGLVQIPCIERNAMAAMRSLDHACYALLSDGRHKVSFDAVVDVMMETGQALPSLYRETSLGGLARMMPDK
jgi:L-serine dehydratase